VKTGGLAGARGGNGFVSFNLLPAADPNAVAEPGSLLVAAALGGLVRLRWRHAQG
jgi:hypothetical protein